MNSFGHPSIINCPKNAPFTQTTIMPAIQTIKLPAFLPTPRDQLCKLLPPNHDSLAAILGLCLAYLKNLHPTKPSPAEESVQASSHIINLLVHNPLV
jgi:hypothetical protein